MHSLRLDWCDAKAARYAVRHWYERDELPIGKAARIGVWEGGRFIGVVLFGPGPSNALGTRFGFRPTEVCALTRLVLDQHRTPTTRILRIAILMLHRQSPGIRVVLTYNDPSAGHRGTVYQAANWLYLGETAPDKRYRYHGRWLHSREVKACGWTGTPGGGRRWTPKPSECELVERLAPKQRYGWPMDNDARERMLPFALPYPQRVGSDTGDTSGDPAGRGRSDADPHAPIYAVTR